MLGVKYGFAPTPETLLYARNAKIGALPALKEQLDKLGAEPFTMPPRSSTGSLPRRLSKAPGS